MAIDRWVSWFITSPMMLLSISATAAASIVTEETCQLSFQPYLLSNQRHCVVNWIRHSSLHDRSTRPAVNPRKPIQVYANLYLIQIMDVDESKQYLRTNIQLRLEWCNRLLSWNQTALTSPALVNYIIVKRRDIWTPDIIVHNGINMEGDAMQTPSEGYLLRVLNDGIVRWHFQEMWITKCEVSTGRFPFDTQLCSIVIRSSAMPASTLTLIASKPIVVSNFIKTEWTVRGSWTHEIYIFDEVLGLNFTALKFTFKMKRQSMV
ncbi:hypothetical protein ACOME3_005810 [Neoechinorhynchus agilis]